jgi:hypothetical protein
MFTNLSMTRFLPGKNNHKNNDNNYCALIQDVVESVLTYIQDKDAIEGEVYATRVIRSFTKTELRDKEIGDVDLPSNTTNREMYELYCFNPGWNVKSDNKGRYPKVVDYKRRKAGNIFWQADKESFEVCYWWSFRNIWKEHCSNSRIRSPCNDTCGECKIFRNAFCYCSSKVGKVDDDVSDGKPSLKSNQPLMTKMVKHFLTRMISRLLLLMMIDVLIHASIKNGSLKPLGSILPRPKECVTTSKRQQRAPVAQGPLICTCL